MNILLKNIKYNPQKFFYAEPFQMMIDHLKIYEGEFIGITGNSGSGKTTLARLISSIVNPDSGEILYFSSNWKIRYEVQQIRRRLGYVFQFPERQFFRDSIYDDIFSGFPDGEVNLNSSAEKIKEFMELFEMNTELLKKVNFLQLSGGERRKAAVISALVKDPELLIMDEPTTGLDGVSCAKLLDLSERLRDSGKTVLWITHDIDMIWNYTSRIVVLESGGLIFCGRREELLKKRDILERLGI
ncbi:MAG: energy-coupling factor ABC transporter ATP-binding protein [Fidelibacterota bacterium]